MSGAGKSRQRQSERNDINAFPTDPIAMVDFMDGRGCHARQILTPTPPPCPYTLGPLSLYFISMDPVDSGLAGLVSMICMGLGSKYYVTGQGL